MEISVKIQGKPFVKWAGGKTQLLNQIEQAIPKELKKTRFTYIEPFVGGGAVLFHILNNYPELEKVVINDINIDLINTYKTIRKNVFDLIQILQKWEAEYHSLSEQIEKKKEYYYEKRYLYNLRISDQTIQSALFIFLNRTCFNGLYRVNRKNEFNVPIGSYKKPMICDEPNLLTVNSLLQKVEILNEDFEQTIFEAEENSFFYFDPPYKPLSQTSSFNSYTKDEFDDNEQIRLAKFCDKLDSLGHNWILSNSDVKGKNSNDDFFDDLFKEYQINRVLAKRIINANPSKRGQLTELLITN
ncbi:MAG: DNA adenine methylase [Bacteroidetes bacterium]|jgi:DNA adenine methylase|nr:DNA adenine methylase [Bacteroidota bacterium]MBT6687605.1 DNA adenine methylase [Bacteroidota bacterium]MBT7143664.1 DNA adenine methylase [Bacteroidota bacterium]MBT7492312.1 DNA adenine methylase [Bacteroidota bacterium]